MYMELFDVSQIEGFDWDEGNLSKNEKKHGITWKECEEIFKNKPLAILPDHEHSHKEERYEVFGKTDKDKELALIITLRRNLIRIISARAQNKWERKKYQSINH